MTRYITETVKLTDEERQVLKDERINEAQDRIEAGYRALRDAEEWQPPAEEQRRVAVSPGDPRYESATREINDVMRDEAERVRNDVYARILTHSSTWLFGGVGTTLTDEPR